MGRFSTSGSIGLVRMDIRKTTANLAKIAFFWIKLYFSVALFLAAIPVIFYFCYLLGHRILEGGMLGGDTAYHMSWIHTLQRYFPRIPMWFPFGGSGASIVLGYWVFPYYLAIIGDYLTNLTVEQWVRFLEFLSVPIVCLEIYLYLWLRMKNQVMATLGALLYPLSSVAWGWVAHAGFYAMQLSTALILPAFFFFDLYLETELVDPGRAVRKRLYLLAFSLFLALGIVTHGSVMPSLFLGLPFYALLRSQLSPRRSEKRAISFLRAAKALLISITFGLLIAAFFLLPQMRYFAFQAKQQTAAYGPYDIPQLPWRGFLGFERLSGSVGSLYTPLFLSILISIFGLVGIFFALVRRKFLAALGLVAFFYVWWFSSTRFLAQNFPFLSMFLLPTNVRTVSVTAIYLTIMAAYGLWSIADIPGVALRFVGRQLGKIGKAGKIAGLGLGKLSLLLSSVLVAALSIWAFYSFRPLQIYPAEENKEWGLIEAYQGYGFLSPSAPNPPLLLCKVPGWEDEAAEWSGRGRTCQEVEPKFVIDSVRVDMAPKDFDEKVKDLDLGKLTRVSISPFLGGIVFSFADHAEASMVEIVSGQAALNLSWIGIHDKALFLAGEETAHEVAEIAKWFGTRYVFLPEVHDARDVLGYRYPENVWPPAAKVDEVVIREFKESPGMATLSTKPAVLVIGSEKKKAYFLVFRHAVKGAISFDQALLVQGTPNIDDYSLEELKQFSTIILHGYSYRNRQRAWGLLKDFVEGGGTLFFDTGWQYVAKDWGKGPDREGNFLEVELPEPSPVKKTLWGSVGKSWDNAALGTELGDGLKLEKFAPPVWEDLAWGMALAERGDLQPWAEPVLTSGDKVIIARGTFGEGKVVWSGMNLFAHAYDKKSEEEYRLIKKIFNFLLESEEIEEGEVLIDWEFPDRIELTLSKVPKEPSFLYWAETWTPNWSAYLLRDGKREPLKIYQAGAGFKAMRLTGLSGGEKLVLEYSLKRTFLVSFGITFLTLLVLLVLILDALLLNQSIERKITARLLGRYPLPSWEELGQSLRKRIFSTTRWEAEEE